MRMLHSFRLGALLFAVGCMGSDPTAVSGDGASPVEPPAAQVTEGKADLIVRGDIMKQQWVVRDENLPATFCSVIEGGITPGVRRLIRFTVMTPNVGDADVHIGDPNQYFSGGESDLYEYADCHAHYHFKHYALYELVDANTGQVWRAAKRGFCMLDTDPNPAWYGQPARQWQYRSCGSLSSPGNQGITAGWTDTYRFTLGGQYFVLDGGDGQPPVPPGEYLLRVTVNPAYAPPRRGGCPRATDLATGLCHQFEEGNYANNVTTVTVTIPAHVGRDGHGPLAGSELPKNEAAEH